MRGEKEGEKIINIEKRSKRMSEEEGEGGRRRGQDTRISC